MTDDEIDDRLSKRFGDEDADDSDESTDMTSQTNKKSQTSQKAQNIKKEWNVRSFYLDDDLDAELTTAFKRLDLNLDETDTNIDLKKTRHFYPLIVQLGLERLEEMEVTELTNKLED